MADVDSGGLSSLTKDTASLLSYEQTTGVKRSREMESNKGSSTAAEPTKPSGIIGVHPLSDRSKKHLTVTFSSGRRVGDGATSGATTSNEEASAAVFITSPDSISKGIKRTPGADSRTSYVSTTSSNDSGGGSRGTLPKKSPSAVSYDNYAGPCSGGGSGGGNDLAKFLRDDSIWRDLKVDFANPDESSDMFVSDDLLDISGASSNGRGSERSWTPSSVRNRVEKIRVKCLPTLANIKSFVFAICILIVIHGALATGYTMSVITTIEKRFEISSRTSGLVVSSYEFGSLLSVIFVSYFGSNGHIPRVVGVGGVILAIGSFLFSLPHFIAPNYVPSNSSGNGFAPDTCSSENASSVDISEKKNSSCADSNEAYVMVLMFAQILLGIGGTPLFTLGTTYIDNHVEKESASIYLAFMYVSMALGPVIGFLLGALMLSEYVNARVPEFLTTSSPDWVGLWWGGFIVCGVLYAISSLPFFLFPRRLSNKRANDEDNEYGRSWRKIPVSILRLLKNSVYMVATLNACIELAIVTGFTVFLPKYLETQFRVTTSNASALTGAVAVPGACVGIFFGGWIMKRFKLELQGVATLVVLINVTAMFMMVGFFLFGCGTLDIAGVTAIYRSPISSKEPIRGGQGQRLYDQCNENCHCSKEELQLKQICGVDGLIYMSPCFAGCKVANRTVQLKQSIVGEFDRISYDYSQCSCIASPLKGAPSGNSTTSSPFLARDGMCDDDCSMLVPFMILVFALSLAASNNQMPVVMVTLRSVSTQEKAFALGVQVVILRLLSYIPSPIIYGDVIDNTCVYWNQKCGSEKTNCLVYDIDGFRLRFASLSMGLIVASVAFSILLWFCIRRRYTPFSPPVTMSEIARRFGDFDNLHIVRSGKLRSWVSDDSLVNKKPYTPRHQKTRSC